MGREESYQVGFIQGEAREWRRLTGNLLPEELDENIQQTNKDYIIN